MTFIEDVSRFLLQNDHDVLLRKMTVVGEKDLIR